MSAGANYKFHGLFGSFAEITAQVRAGTQNPPEIGDTARFKLADGTLGECSFGSSGWREDRRVTPSGDTQFAGAVVAPNINGGLRYDMPKARLALADVTSGVGRMLINFIGDSHNRGSGQGTGADGTGSGTKNKWRLCPSGQLRSMLAARGIPAQNDCVIGSGVLASIGTTNAEVVDFDGRIALSGTYVYTSQAAGGSTYKILSGTGTMTLTPDQAWNNWEVIALVGSGQTGSLTVRIAGETDFVVASLSSAANPPNPTKYTGARAANAGVAATGTIQVITTANANVILVRVWDASKSQVDILNWACGGAAIADLWPVASGYNQAAVMGLYSPHLTIAEIFHNDAVQNIPVATWLAGVERLIVAAQTTGDIMMLAGFPGDRTQFNDPNLTNRYNALKDLCDTYKVNLFDLRRIFGATYAEVTAKGLNFDTDHWNRRGGGLYSQHLMSSIMSGVYVQ